VWAGQSAGLRVLQQVIGLNHLVFEWLNISLKGNSLMCKLKSYKLESLLYSHIPMTGPLIMGRYRTVTLADNTVEIILGIM